MRTTLDLPDDLATEIKILAAQERTTMKELIGDLLRGGIRARLQPSKNTGLPAVHRFATKINREWLGELRGEGRA
jgi:hypothetical protein